MCILCLASRWSRRIVTLLPWLIIPLIILWALSQLLPSEFQFEVTSPRLACVGVLLVSLGWYELAMPRLTTWRAKRSAYLKERRRLEVQEAAKWRKEATRLCRNCSAPYRDQKPACGKFVCTFCGHMSRRPVLDVPPSTMVKASSVASPGFEDHSVEAPWVCRIWPKCMKFSMFGAWMVGRGAPFPLCSRWRAEHGCAGKENYRGDFSIFFLVVRVCCIGLVCLKWLGQKACGGDVGPEEALLLAGGRGGDGDMKEDDGENKKGSRGAEKARRKAEEKRLARLAREQMEADERRQREEVARLVEERRRLRDEKVEAERAAIISAEREMAAAERERLQQDDERRRQEKLKKREVPKDNNKLEDRSQKRECKLKGGSPNPSPNPNPKAAAPPYPATKTIPVVKESVVKFPVKHVKSELGAKVAGSALKPGRCSSSRTPRSPAKVHQSVVSPSAWDNSPAAAAKPVSEPLCTKKVALPSHVNSGYSAWKNMRWNVWGKAAPTTPSEVCATSPALPSNFDLQRAACSDFLDKGDWFGGVHARGDTTQRELNNFSDLEADVIIKVNPTNHVAPIGPQQAIHAETFGSSSHLGGKHSASTMVSEPWANNSDEFSTRRHSNVEPGVLGGGEAAAAAAAAASEDGNWKMWEAPQLDQIQLPCIKDSSADPLAWMLPLGLSSEVASPMGVSAQLLPPNCYSSSQQPDYSHSSCPVPLPTRSTSLWSDPSFFSSTTLQQQQRQSGATVGSPITPSGLLMEQPIPSADDLFYEHPPAAALPKLQNYTTSLNPGERFTLFSDREFVIDRPLQPDQRSAMEREASELQESRSKWSVGIPSAADWSTPGATNTKSADTNYRDFYSAPSAPSLWSINAS